MNSEHPNSSAEEESGDYEDYDADAVGAYEGGYLDPESNPVIWE